MYSVSTSVLKGNVSDKIQVYPNPSEGLVKGSFDGNNGSLITVKDMYGSSVYSSKINGTVSEIDLSTLESGVYFVNVKNGSEEGVVKLIIE